MKKVLLLGLFALFCTCVYSQNVYDKIFFTEYLVGGIGQRALEIGNNTGSPITLNNLRLRVYFNGNTSAITNVLPNAEDGTTTIASGSVFVIYNNSVSTPNLNAATMPNTTASNRVGLDNVLTFSGNDAIELQYYVDAVSGWQTVDFIGKRGENPGLNWTAGSLHTNGMSLSRKSTVTIGLQQNPADFSAVLYSQWKANNNYTLPASGIFESLGQHSFSNTFNIKTVTTYNPEQAVYSPTFHYSSIGNQATNTLSNYPLKSSFTPYGGSAQNKLTAGAGYFRTFKDADGKWSLVDPDGYEFFSYGMNGIKYPNNSRNLPEDLLDINLNTMGGWSDFEKINNDVINSNDGRKMPYTTALGLLIDYSTSADGTSTRRIDLNNRHIYPIFGPIDEPKFREFCDSLLTTKITENMITDKYLLGYYSDNEIKAAFTTSSLAIYLKSTNYPAGTSDPTYQYVKSWYASIGGTTPSAPTADEKKAWYLHFADTYYRVVKDAIKARDPNHLILSSRLTVNEKELTDLFSTMGNYIDVFTLNYYWQWTPDIANDINDWGYKADKPVIITEFGAKGLDVPGQDFGDATYVNPLRTATFNVPTQQDRANFFEHYGLELMKSKYCVGFHWYKYADYDLKKNGTPVDSFVNRGLVNKDYQMYQQLKGSIEKIGRNIYNLRKWRLGIKEDQTIAFSPIADKELTDTDFYPDVTTSSDLNVMLTSSNASVATIDPSNKIHIVGSGKTIITAIQSGDANFNAASATQQLIVKGNQTITFNPIADAFVLNPDFSGGATASSGLDITYNTSDVHVAKIDPVTSKIQLVGPGIVTITASQAGNDVYYPAVSVSRTFTVSNVIKLQAEDDAYVKNGSNTDTKFGITDSTVLSTKNDSNTGYLRESYLKFNLAPLVGGTVQSAQLKMTISNFNGPSSAVIKAFPVSSDSWDEEHLTYTTKPTYLSTSAGSATASFSGQELALTITSYIAQELAGNQLASLCLRDDVFNHDIVVDFYSKEEMLNPANKPVLEITVVKDDGNSTISAINTLQNFKSIQLEAPADQVMIYPNPASTFVTVIAPESLHYNLVQIYDTLGNLKQSGKFNGNRCELNIENLAFGVYVVKINGDSKGVIKKIIKN